MAKRLTAAAILVLGVAFLFGKAEAKIKPNPTVDVNIPYAFQLANRTLPAGTYKFELATGTPAPSDKVGVLIVRNRDARIYQAIAVLVEPGAGLPDESRAVFAGGDDHILISLWKNGDRFDVNPGLAAAADDADDWSADSQLMTVSARLSDR